MPRASTPLRTGSRSSRSGRAARATGVAVLMLLALAARASADDPPPRAAPESPAPSVAAFLEKAWPGHPEWLAVLADILVKGDRIGGGDGWFRKAVSRTRFDWNSTRFNFDNDGDGAVSRTEFHGTAVDFARLDRDRNGLLNAADFDFDTTPQGAPFRFPALQPRRPRRQREGHPYGARSLLQGDGPRGTWVCFARRSEAGVRRASDDPESGHGGAGRPDALDAPEDIPPRGTRPPPAWARPQRTCPRLHAPDGRRL